MPVLRSGDSPARGFGETAVGFKWQSPSDNGPDLSVIGRLDLPTGAHRLRQHGVRPAVRTALSWERPNDFELGVMPGLKYDTDDEGRRFINPSLGIALVRQWTPNARVFIEGAAPQIAASKHGGVIAYKNVGASYFFGKDIEVGGRIGWRANHNTPAHQYLLMVAARY